ncbi:type I-E CRISPR-associated protein Cas6/Cse3/CasE [Corynebacterium hylobatis]|uniref:Type I-E CRISPR-associated protein Cas6/Cse3/CasE n=1 Tax=Corynebacterium hylobatis TaxID=1859290 RepID=A0A3S0B467_9CORY|nr:type I-E CRISPR-associated protein Cas6/Cse3/CasE [Corynebacterium hylobatis]RSZ63182.1 type I-E CRISPR-associated protein Cas6/Cse3/CasE [Corynebacterium hylobatis]
MYLSRMYLNNQRRQTRALLANPQMMHAAVLSSFPPDSSAQTEEGRVLWRIDRTREETALYVVSPSIPSFEHLQEQSGWAQEPSWQTSDYSQMLNRITKGQRYAFRLTANPVHTVTEEGKKRRVAHITAEHQLRWLIERQEQLGARIADDAGEPTASVNRSTRMVFNRNGRRVTIQQVTFDGVLEVTAADSLRLVLTSGLGKARGYGCGLLTLAPLKITS